MNAVERAISNEAFQPGEKPLIGQVMEKSGCNAIMSGYGNGHIVVLVAYDHKNCSGCLFEPHCSEKAS